MRFWMTVLLLGLLGCEDPVEGAGDIGDGAQVATDGGQADPIDRGVQAGDATPDARPVEQDVPALAPDAEPDLSPPDAAALPPDAEPDLSPPDADLDSAFDAAPDRGVVDAAPDLSEADSDPDLGPGTTEHDAAEDAAADVAPDAAPPPGADNWFDGEPLRCPIKGELGVPQPLESTLVDYDLCAAFAGTVCSITRRWSDSPRDYETRFLRDGDYVTGLRGSVPLDEWDRPWTPLYGLLVLGHRSAIHSGHERGAPAAVDYRRDEGGRITRVDDVEVRRGPQGEVVQYGDHTFRYDREGRLIGWRDPPRDRSYTWRAGGFDYDRLDDSSVELMAGETRRTTGRPEDPRKQGGGEGDYTEVRIVHPAGRLESLSFEYSYGNDRAGCCAGNIWRERAATVEIEWSPDGFPTRVHAVGHKYYDEEGIIERRDCTRTITFERDGARLARRVTVEACEGEDNIIDGGEDFRRYQSRHTLTETFHTCE